MYGNLFIDLTPSTNKLHMWQYNLSIKYGHTELGKGLSTLKRRCTGMRMTT